MHCTPFDLTQGHANLLRSSIWGRSGSAREADGLAADESLLKDRQSAAAGLLTNIGAAVDELLGGGGHRGGVGAVQSDDTEDIGSAALRSAAQAGAEASLTRLHDVGGNSHGGAGKSEDGEELHVGWFR